jgi:predicted Zn-dependent protease with MMP-like domain
VTDLLKRAFDAVSQLPDDEQDAMAELLLAELASEKKWEERFAKSQDSLSLLAQEALDEHARGETEDLDPESL